MKPLRLILPVLLLLASGAAAQDLIVRDFQSHPSDRSAVMRENLRKDKNGQTAALVKIYTPLQADEITLSGDANGFVGENGTSTNRPTQHAPGEVWMWVPGRSRAVEFTHPLGHVRFLYPQALEAGKVYSLMLNTDGMVYSIQALSDGAAVNGAEVYINGEKEGTTPLNVFVPYGIHHVRAVKGSLVYDGNIDFPRSSSGKIRLPMEDEEMLKGTLRLLTERDAEIWHDGKRLGLGDATFRDFAGTYRFETRKANADPAETTISIKARRDTTVTLNAPVPHLGYLALRTIPEGGVHITCDGEEFNPVSRLTPGTYRLNFTRRGYNTASRSFTVEKNSNILDTVILSRKQYLKDKTVYGAVGYDIGSLGGLNIMLGGVYAGFDLSVAYTLGLQKSDRVNWFDAETNLFHSACEYYVDRVAARAGYQFTFIERIGLTPQAGWEMQYLRGGELGNGAACHSVSVGARLSFFPFQHCGVFVAPHYAIAVKKGEKWTQLKPLAALTNGGFHLQAGFIFNL